LLYILKINQDINRTIKRIIDQL